MNKFKYQKYKKKIEIQKSELDNNLYKGKFDKTNF